MDIATHIERDYIPTAEEKEIATKFAHMVQEACATLQQEDLDACTYCPLHGCCDNYYYQPENFPVDWWIPHIDEDT